MEEMIRLSKQAQQAKEMALKKLKRMEAQGTGNPLSELSMSSDLQFDLKERMISSQSSKSKADDNHPIKIKDLVSTKHNYLADYFYF